MTTNIIVLMLCAALSLAALTDSILMHRRAKRAIDKALPSDMVRVAEVIFGRKTPRPDSARVYIDTNDWWIGYYRGDAHHYLCPLPTLVVRWSRRTTTEPKKETYKEWLSRPLNENCSATPQEKPAKP